MADWNPDLAPEPPSPSKLTAEERVVLGALLLWPDAPASSKTAEAGATRLNVELADFAATLRVLEGLEPVPFRRERDAVTGEELLFPNNEAIELLDPPPDPD